MFAIFPGLSFAINVNFLVPMLSCEQNRKLCMTIGMVYQGWHVISDSESSLNKKILF